MRSVAEVVKEIAEKIDVIATAVCGATEQSFRNRDSDELHKIAADLRSLLSAPALGEEDWTAGPEERKFCEVAVQEAFDSIALNAVMRAFLACRAEIIRTLRDRMMFSGEAEYRDAVEKVLDIANSKGSLREVCKFCGEPRHGHETDCPIGRLEALHNGRSSK